MNRDRAYTRARDELLQAQMEQDLLKRRAAILDVRKESARHRYYAEVDAQVKKIAPGQSKKAPRLALEAKLVGVNLPFLKGRHSVDAQYVALKRQIVGGFARDLEAAGLLKLFASRSLEDKWTDELFELNKGPAGKPGITKDAQALAIAKTIQKWQKASMDQLNNEGAWVRSYSGYITKTSHDADAIRRAGPERWANETLPHLDLKRTFGTADRQEALDALRQMWTPFSTGDHFDYGRPSEEPIFPNTAKKAAASRELHFKSGQDWRAYNEKYGVQGPTGTVVQAMSITARRTALMKEFGTRPAEAFERDMNFIKASLQQEGDRATSKLNALEVAAANPAAPMDVIAPQMQAASAAIEEAADRFGHFASWEQALRNRFAQIDGTSMKPVNKAMANVVSNWMAIQRMAKLGRVALTHFASLPTKALEARYWGIPFARRFGSLFSGMTQGAAGSDKRAALDLTLVAFENRLGHMMAQYDVADAPAAFISRMEATFFRLIGVSSVVDNQRGDAEAMFAAHVGGKRGQDWANIGRKEQRVLQGFGIGEKEWKALHGVEWTQLGDRTYLFPPDAIKLSDEQVRAYARDANPLQASRGELGAHDIAKIRNDLAMSIATAYSDRAGYAVPMPNARIRAILFGKNYEPGTVINSALKLLYQFKLWPADMITRAWEREIYGTIGGGRYDRLAGIMEVAVAGIVFGVASEDVRAALQGRNPIAEMEANPAGTIVRGAQRSGLGSLLGDYLLGQYDRHGLDFLSSAAGPTFGHANTLMDLLYAGSATASGRWSASAWRGRGADAIKLARDNTPFASLWFTSLALNTFVWHRLQEWISPGYLKRSEQRQKQQQGTEFWLSPAKVDAYLTGRARSPH
jgi:hypothetical protein